MHVYTEPQLKVRRILILSVDRKAYMCDQFKQSLGVRPILNRSVEGMRAQHAGLMSIFAPQYPPSPSAVRTYDGTYETFTYRPAAATGVVLVY